jgi:hypothetical protein
MYSPARLLRLAMCAATLVSAGCMQRQQPPVEAPAIDSHAGQKAVTAYDAASKGYLDTNDMQKAPCLQTYFARVPHDEQGHVTSSDIQTRIAMWKESGLRRFLMPCRILKNGRPLAGAVVTFVPEAFLGPDLKTGSGTTDVNGFTKISVPGIDPPGIAPGFYRVQVTKPGEAIPARYNTATILAEELAADNPHLVHGAEFRLEY